MRARRAGGGLGGARASVFVRASWALVERAKPPGDRQGFAVGLWLNMRERAFAVDARQSSA
eukprot:9471460-Lingulodinium_polyedra.AAC.1